MPSRFARATPSMLEDAVVDGHDETGALLARDLHDLRGQPVAVAPAVRHHEPHVGGSEQTQAAHRDGAAGGAVGVVVADHDDARRGLDGVVEQCGGPVDVEQPVRREQACEGRGRGRVDVAIDGARARAPGAGRDGSRAGRAGADSGTVRR